MPLNGVSNGQNWQPADLAPDLGLWLVGIEPGGVAGSEQQSGGYPSELGNQE
jgi:hypothetical protein